jgi:hypothetical protein
MSGLDRLDRPMVPLDRPMLDRPTVALGDLKMMVVSQ